MSKLVADHVTNSQVDRRLRFLLHVLAGFAQDDGTNIYVGTGRLMKIMGVTKRAVQLQRQALLDQAILIHDGEHGRYRRYRIDLDKLAAIERRPSGRPRKVINRTTGDPGITRRQHEGRSVDHPLMGDPRITRKLGGGRSPVRKGVIPRSPDLNTTNNKDLDAADQRDLDPARSKVAPAQQQQHSLPNGPPMLVECLAAFYALWQQLHDGAPYDQRKNDLQHMAVVWNRAKSAGEPVLDVLEAYLRWPDPYCSDPERQHPIGLLVINIGKVIQWMRAQRTLHLTVDELADDENAIRQRMSAALSRHRLTRH